MPEILAVVLGTLAGWAAGPQVWHVIAATAVTTVATYLSAVAWRGWRAPR